MNSFGFKFYFKIITKSELHPTDIRFTWAEDLDNVFFFIKALNMYFLLSVNLALQLYPV